MLHSNNGYNNSGEGVIKPDPETLHTTDPQEHMKGPVSSLMHDIRESFDYKNAGKNKDAQKEPEEK